MMKDFLPSFPLTHGPLGLYVHVPFCRSRCHYCAFVTNPYDEEQAERYVRCVIRETELWSECGLKPHGLDELSFDTIYIGGGTPSLLRPDQLDRLLKAVRSGFRILEPVETTIEINPGTAGLNDLLAFRGAGVNRASLGIQSLNDRELHLMGRGHTAEDALEAFENLRSAGYEDVSVDLIAGFPGQDVASLCATLQLVIDLGPEHISIYLLELKEHSRLAEQVTFGQLPPLDDDLAAEMYENFCEIVTAAGYEHYEISNFAIPGHRSRHNLKYWTDSLYVGLGAGAHGMIGLKRYANDEEFLKYEQTIQRGDLPFASSTSLAPETRFKEALIMGLRLVHGLDLAELGARYQVDARAFILDTVDDLLDQGLCALDHDRICLTARGRLLSNLVFSRWI